MPNSIVHVDMDAFYASVEERDRPELRGRPVIVGGDPEGRGVVSAANYEARKFGVHSAMPSVTAGRLCPQGVFLRPRMDHYAAVSRQIRQIFHRFTPLVEPLAFDEAFLDVTGTEKLFGTPEQIGRRIKQTIRSELELVASVGIAPNKFLAKLASDLDKPDGFVVVRSGEVQGFLDPLDVKRIWGVGRVAARRLERLGIQRIEQLRALGEPLLSEHFGAHGEHLWRLANGIDDRSVVPDHAAKSISHETTFADDIRDSHCLRGCLMELMWQVAARLRRHERVAKTVQLKLRYSDFDTVVRSISLTQPTSITRELTDAVLDLFDSRLPSRPLVVRLIGAGVSRIEDSGTRQPSLFDREHTERLEQLDRTTDAIRDRFGRSSLGPATSLDRTDRLRGRPDDS